MLSQAHSMTTNPQRTTTARCNAAASRLTSTAGELKRRMTATRGLRSAVVAANCWFKGRKNRNIVCAREQLKTTTTEAFEKYMQSKADTISVDSKLILEIFGIDEKCVQNYRCAYWREGDKLPSQVFFCVFLRATFSCSPTSSLPPLFPQVLFVIEWSFCALVSCFCHFLE